VKTSRVLTIYMCKTLKLDLILNPGAQLITVPFDLAEQVQIRESMPLMQHRKLVQF